MNCKQYEFKANFRLQKPASLCTTVRAKFHSLTIAGEPEKWIWFSPTRFISTSINLKLFQATGWADSISTLLWEEKKKLTAFPRKNPLKSGPTWFSLFERRHSKPNAVIFFILNYNLVEKKKTKKTFLRLIMVFATRIKGSVLYAE